MVPLSCINGASRPRARRTKWKRTRYYVSCIVNFSPQLREYKTVLDSGFHALESGFQLPDSKPFLVELGFRIPIVSGISDSYICIPDSKAQDSGFHMRKFSRFRNADSLTCGGILCFKNYFLTLRWFDTVFQDQYLPSLSINYVAINKLFWKNCHHSYITFLSEVSSLQVKAYHYSRHCLQVSFSREQQ